MPVISYLVLLLSLGHFILLAMFIPTTDNVPSGLKEWTTASGPHFI